MERHRIDHWLKLVCLFKHREEAAEACRGGHVKINGARVKPSAAVKEDDVIEFLLNDRFRRVIAVVLPDAQLSKEAARTAYIDESPPQQEVGKAAFRDRGGLIALRPHDLRPTTDDHHALTNLLISTLAIRPIAIMNIIVDEPPYEISGNGMPVVGSTP